MVKWSSIFESDFGWVSTNPESKIKSIRSEIPLLSIFTSLESSGRAPCTGGWLISLGRHGTRPKSWMTDLPHYKIQYGAGRIFNSHTVCKIIEVNGTRSIGQPAKVASLVACDRTCCEQKTVWALVRARWHDLCRRGQVQKVWDKNARSNLRKSTQKAICLHDSEKISQLLLINLNIYLIFTFLFTWFSLNVLPCFCQHCDSRRKNSSCLKIDFQVFNVFNRLLRPLSHDIVEKNQKNCLSP